MIRIGIIGDIGSGKTFVDCFRYPMFNADEEVKKIYQKITKTFFNKLKKKFPKYILNFPINKNRLKRNILNKKNLKLYQKLFILMLE